MLAEADVEFGKALSTLKSGDSAASADGYSVEGRDFSMNDGHIVVAAITSCTNTSNPSVLIAAGLVARNARAKGLTVKPWVKTSLAPGSQVVTDYLDKADLTKDLDAMGFNLVGYGCTTCIGNSGPLAEEISEAIHAHDSSPARYCPVTAISRAASRRMCAPTILLHRRSLLPMRWSVRCIATSSPSPRAGRRWQ